MLRLDIGGSLKDLRRVRRKKNRTGSRPDVVDVAAGREHLQGAGYGPGGRLQMAAMIAAMFFRFRQFASFVPVALHAGRCKNTTKGDFVKRIST